MKFFKLRPTTLTPNHLLENWAYPCDGQDIPEPSHPLCCPYSKHRNLRPKSADPNNGVSTQEILAVNGENYDLLTFLPTYSHLTKEDVQREYEHDPCLQHLLISLHFRYCKLKLKYPYNVFEYRHAIHDNDISLSIQYEHLNDLHYATASYIQTYCKDTKIKVTAIKLQGFNREIDNKNHIVISTTISSLSNFSIISPLEFIIILSP